MAITNLLHASHELFWLRRWGLLAASLALAAAASGCVVAPRPYHGGVYAPAPNATAYPQTYPSTQPSVYPSAGYPAEVTVAPPAAQVEVMLPSPGPAYVWVGGYWGWYGHRHVWMPGRWIANRPGYYWHPHTWYRHGNGWREAPGQWKRR